MELLYRQVCAAPDVTGRAQRLWTMFACPPPQPEPMLWNGKHFFWFFSLSAVNSQRGLGLRMVNFCDALIVQVVL